MGPSTTPLAPVIVGVLAGGLAGLFGVGGGILIVPGLVLLSRMEQRIAHGTSLAAILPVAAAGTLGFALDDAIDWPVAAFVAGGSVIGAAVGTTALRHAPEQRLRIGFSLFLLLTASALFLQLGESSGRGPMSAALGLGLVGLGGAAGMLAGLFGVGGGAIVVPALVLLFGMPDALAKGTSLVVIIPTALVGTVQNVRFGNADLSTASVVGLTGAISAFICARVALRLDPVISSMLFGALLVVVAARLFLQRS